MIENSKLGYYLSPILRVWLFMFFLLLCTIPFGLIAQFNFLPSISNLLLKDILVQVSLVLIVLSALLMMFKLFPSVSFYSVFIRKESVLPEFFKGVGTGVAIMLLCAALLYLNGNAIFVKIAFSWQTLCLYLVYFLLVSVFEEFLFRSYPLQVLADRYPFWFAVFVNGLLFVLAHFANPNLSVLGIINITLAGMLFAIYTLQKQQIAWAVGVHFAWNFIQAIVLGYPVSGNKITGLTKAIPVGPTYLSGGEFGLKGSIFCTIFLLAFMGFRIYKFGPDFFRKSISPLDEDEQLNEQ
ncbi:lysostaphin resistance A-like protein [Pedobacter sp.]